MAISPVRMWLDTVHLEVREREKSWLPENSQKYRGFPRDVLSMDDVFAWFWLGLLMVDILCFHVFLQVSDHLVLLPCW